MVASGERQGLGEPDRLISKAADTWAALGPVLVRGLDYRNLKVVTLLDGEVVNEGNTSDLVNDVPSLISYISRYITLLPGDILLSGTPANSRPVQPGDVVEVEVEGLGTLRNTIVEGSIPIREDVGAQPSESEEVVSTTFGGDWELRGIRPPRRD